MTLFLCLQNAPAEQKRPWRVRDQFPRGSSYVRNQTELFRAVQERTKKISQFPSKCHLTSNSANVQLPSGGFQLVMGYPQWSSMSFSRTFNEINHPFLGRFPYPMCGNIPTLPRPKAQVPLLAGGPRSPLLRLRKRSTDYSSRNPLDNGYGSICLIYGDLLCYLLNRVNITTNLVSACFNSQIIYKYL